MSKKHKSKKFKPGKSRKSKSAEQQLKETSTQDLIISMNYTLSILQARGVRILNWDDKGKELGLIKMFKCKPYYAEGIVELEEVQTE